MKTTNETSRSLGAVPVVGTLIRARGREWVVQPGSTPALLRVKPLGAPDLEATAILTKLEPVTAATFALPDPAQAGHLLSARMLRDAVRLGFRASAGPFRSLGSIAVEPRPYQFVPLLMALRQDPVRLLIADDAGIGKTVEAGLIAKELISRAECRRLCVLCPPHLADQWRSELETKFNLEPVLVLPSTVSKLERHCPPGVSVFEQFPVTVVSLDYIKSERRRNDFLRTCPELVIVDEAHTCTQSGQGAQQQRFRLLQALGARADRHLILVTATPHSGNEAAFRSLLSLLNPDFAALPDDMTGESNRHHREALAAQFVQRRRGDILHYMREDTPFPDREEAERTYKLHGDYRKFLDSALKYAREIASDVSGTRFQQRIRWWSALALLRSISSSPAAAAATLRARANNADSEDAAEIEELGRSSVMDLAEAELAEAVDVAPGADFEAENSLTRRKLLAMAREAETLMGARDSKLTALAAVVKDLLKDGFSPIVFCKYIPSAEYFAEELRKRLRGPEVACVTGQLHHDEREARVQALSAHESRVLVCTDCLSEGINLQESFDAVVHADLAWAPTRHEQREGRVDRFRQRSPKVRVVTFYGEDNPVDGIVLNILLKKHKTIRNSLGISVPVPMNSDKVLEAVFESLLMRGSSDTSQLSLFDDMELREHSVLNQEWDQAADREKKSRTLFAQHGIKAEEVQPELDEVRRALGAPIDVERFVGDALTAYGCRMQGTGKTLTLDLAEAPLALRDALRYEKPIRATFDAAPAKGVVSLNRTHPLVEALSSYVLDAALSGDPGAAARRCGVTATDAVPILTTILVLRFRFQLTTGGGSGKTPASAGELLAEDVALAGFRGLPQQPEWLDEAALEPLLSAPPKGNVPPDQARYFLQAVLGELDALRPALDDLAQRRAKEVLQAHRGVRRALEGAQTARRVTVQGEPDVLGLYLLLPFGRG